MTHHQIDLEPGESIDIDGHIVTLHQVDAESRQAVLEIEDPDGSVQMVTVDVAAAQVEEPVLV
mgnify:CR=1 FL=1